MASRALADLLRVSHSQFSIEALRQVARRQRMWAEQREIEVDSNGMVSELAENLFAPLSLETLSALEANRPKLRGDPGKPVELMRLDSSAALLCNVFDYWRGRDCAPIRGACGMTAADSALEFAALIPIAPALTDDSAPPIDLLLSSPEAKPTAIVATFTEPYQVPKAGSNRSGDLLTRDGVWGPLQDCRALALDHFANRRRYQRLRVSQLLQQILALSNRYGPRGFRLLHLWYDVPGHASQQLVREIDRFRMRVGGEVDFTSCSWQALFEKFRPNCGEHLGYADYLGSRYFEP